MAAKQTNEGKPSRESDPQSDTGTLPPNSQPNQASSYPPTIHPPSLFAFKVGRHLLQQPVDLLLQAGPSDRALVLV